MPLHRSPSVMTYSGSARRSMHLRRRLKQRWQRGWITPVVILLILCWWLAVTVWYPVWFLTQALALTVRRDARKHGQKRAEGSHEPRG